MRRDWLRGGAAGQAGPTTGSGEVIAGQVVEVPTQATGGALVLLAHLHIHSGATVPRQREAKHTLHQEVVSQALNEHTTHGLGQTKPTHTHTLVTYTHPYWNNMKI